MHDELIFVRVEICYYLLFKDKCLLIGLQNLGRRAQSARSLEAWAKTLTNEGRGLRAEDVAIWRGDRCLFESLNFELRPGQLALLVGPNGAGKTSLLRVLAGLASPTVGRVSWQGTAVDALPPELRGAIAYRGHLDGLKKDLTVAENLHFFAAIWGGTADLSLLVELKLEAQAHTRARHLSAGQRRRAALVSLRVAASPVWILDEPMTNLDAEGRAIVMRWLTEHLASGGCAIVATHQPKDFERPGALVIEL
ncbi:MAG: heme ABC exporter ATP-binding protein CcmA [Gammaproteobacteria bacterium]